MSPHVLYVTHFEMIWECRAHICCECGYPALGRRMAEGLRDFILVQSAPAHGWTLTDTEKYSSDSAKNWHNLIERYSELYLSVPTDKLPALSGVAKRIAAQRRAAYYIAGLWDDTLPIDLLWVRNQGRDWALWSQGPERRRARAALQDRAPSWSWACRDNLAVFPFGTMFYPNGDISGAGEVRHLWFEITHVECEPATADPHWSVLPGASLTLRGPVLDVELVKPTPDSGYQIVMRGSGPKKRAWMRSAPGRASPFSSTTPMLRSRGPMCLAIPKTRFFV